MIVHKDFITSEEEQCILDEIEPYLKRMRYEIDHWDDVRRRFLLVLYIKLPKILLQAIHGYRETERLKWNENNNKIIDRVRNIAFPHNVEQLKYVHILDLQKDGYIKPHIDAVRVSKTVNHNYVEAKLHFVNSSVGIPQQA